VKHPPDTWHTEVMRHDPREIWGDEPEEQDASEVVEELADNAEVIEAWRERPSKVPLRAVGKFIRKSGKRIAVTVAGFAVLIAGIAMLALPGPGWAAIFLGLAILSTEYVWAQRLLKAAKKKFGEAKDAVLGNRKTLYEVIDRESSKVGALWVRFRTDQPATWPAYAVYDTYESDHRGAYRVVVGVPDSDDGTEAKVAAGRFARFVAEGNEPQALIETWRRIWAVTESGEIERAFTADLEIHHPDRVEVLVALR
jgi:predicted transcriptional regulator YdeE